MSWSIYFLFQQQHGRCTEECGGDVTVAAASSD